MFGHVFQFEKTISTGSRRGFTLVEMLVVMGIIAVLLVVTLPAFKGLNQGNSRRGAVTSLMGTLDRARMMAVSDGLPTYVVFARKTGSGNQVNSSLWGRAYAIFQDVDNVSFNLAQRTPWLYLPGNVAFKVDASTTGNGQSTASVMNQKLAAPGTSSGSVDPAFPVSASAVPANNSGSGAYAVQLPYWKFDSTGAVDDKSLSEQTSGGDGSSDMARNNYLRVLLFSGYINDQGQEISTQNNGGAGNKTATMLDEIDLNPVTGRARYVVDPYNNLSTPTPASSPRT